MSNRLEKIADCELKILKPMWQAGREMTMPEIREALGPLSGWEPVQVKTLLYRLVDKGIVHAEKRGMYCYKPLISEEEYGAYATKALVDKLYGGNVKRLVASLVGGGALTDGDIDELRGMFELGSKGEAR